MVEESRGKIKMFWDKKGSDSRNNSVLVYPIPVLVFF